MVPVAYHDDRKIARDPGYGESVIFGGRFSSSSLGFLARLTPVLPRSVKALLTIPVGDVDLQWEL